MQLVSPYPKLLGVEVGSYISTTFSGYEVSLRSVAGSNNGPAYHALTIVFAQPYGMKVTREGAFHGVGKRLGLAKESVMGRKDLDEYFFISLDNEHRDRNALACSGVVEALEYFITDERFESLRLYPDLQRGKANGLDYGLRGRAGVVLLRKHSLALKSEDRQGVRQALEALVVLIKGVS